LFFFEGNDFRKCLQKPGLSKLNSKADGSIVGFGASTSGQAFYITNSFENS
jgi:hypothetical protein